MGKGQPQGRSFREFEIGQKFTTAARTITEADIVSFAGLSGDYNPMHIDEEFARGSVFGERIAHGLLAVSAVSGFLYRSDITSMSGPILGLNWQFKKAIKIKDTIYAKVVVSEKRESKSLKGQGIITFDITIYNQREEVAQKGELTVMMPLE